MRPLSARTVANSRSKSSRFETSPCTALEPESDTIRSKYDLEAAIADFDRALQLDPKLVDAYVDRGLALLLQGKETEAAKDLERALAIDPSLKEEVDKRIKAANELRNMKR